MSQNYPPQVACHLGDKKLIMKKELDEFLFFRPKKSPIAGA